jgi:hypothetical protein
MAEEYPIYDFNPQSLPLELLQNIGFVAMAAAQLEAAVQDLIGALLGADGIETKALTLHMAAPLKDQVVRSLVGINAMSAETIDETDELMDRVKDALERRNVVLHNSIIKHPDGTLWSLRERSRGELQVELSPIDVESIKEDAALIYHVSIQVIQFMNAYGIAPKNRTRPRHPMINRGKKARSDRIDARRNERINKD